VQDVLKPRHRARSRRWPAPPRSSTSASG
jgi:hypothetical protein